MSDTPETPETPGQLPMLPEPLPRVPPAIDSVEPSRFRADIPTPITIRGVSLYPVTKVTIVFADGSRADCTNVAAAAAGDRVTATTPPGIPGRADVVVSLTGGGNLLSANQASFEEATTAGWIPDTFTTIEATTDQAADGRYSMRLTSAGRPDLFAYTPGGTGGFPVVGDGTYVAWITARAATIGRSGRIRYESFGAGGGSLGSVDIPYGPSSPDRWTAFTTDTVTAPAGAVTGSLLITMDAAAASGEVHYLDAVSMTRSTGDTDVIAAGALTLEPPPPQPRPPPTGPYCDTPATLRLERLNPAGAVVETLDLMDVAGGYRVASLDLPFPDPREVSAALPTRDGNYDTTRLLGPRPVTIGGSLIASSSGTRQAAMEALAYWCQPRLRPRLIYAVDPDETAKTLTLRGAALSGPHTNRALTRFTASWVAPDPIAHGLDLHSVTIGPEALPGGTGFDITFDFRFPILEGGSGIGTVDNAGTYPAWPLLRIYGPCTGPALWWQPPASGAVVMAADFAVGLGDYLEVDTFTQTLRLNGEPGASRYDRLDFAQTRWAGLEPGATRLRFAPRAFAPACQCWVGWTDAWI